MQRVTLAGQSSGGTSIFALLSSPASKGLFAGAISMSGWVPIWFTFYPPRVCALVVGVFGFWCRVVFVIKNSCIYFLLGAGEGSDRDHRTDGETQREEEQMK
jgi:hypothetical protein